jgi:hypothetical protein
MSARHTGFARALPIAPNSLGARLKRLSIGSAGLPPTAGRVIANRHVKTSDLGKRIKPKKIGVNPLYPRHPFSMNPYIQLMIALGASSLLLYSSSLVHLARDLREWAPYLSF